MKYNLKIILFLVLSITFLDTSAFGTQKPYAKKGLYIGIIKHYNKIGGDFDGESFLYGQGFTSIAIPKIESNYGWGISVGMRGDLNEKIGSSLELSYLKSNHEAIFFGDKSEAFYNIINLDFKLYFLPKKRIQPFLLFGWIPYAWLKVKEATIYFDYSAGPDPEISFGDATFRATLRGLNLGSGLSFFIHPRVSLYVEIIYRLIYFGEAEIEERWGISSGGVYDIEDSLSANSLNYSIGMTFTF